MHYASRFGHGGKGTFGCPGTTTTTSSCVASSAARMWLASRGKRWTPTLRVPSSKRTVAVNEGRLSRVDNRYPVLISRYRSDNPWIIDDIRSRQQVHTSPFLHGLIDPTSAQVL